ncbi:MAG: hypothetical protein ACOVQ4_12560, partial [Flectobacillus sp.]|uniref:hypothetical protein n=1 Tax=Flectobacillus sp. TaxID=50419 RepID=UPI003B9984B4
KEDYAGYNSVCKAVKKGMDAWQKQITDTYGSNFQGSEELKKIYEKLIQEKSAILNELDCNGTGYAPELRRRAENPTLYASLSDEFSENFLGYWLLSPCNLAQAQSHSEALVKLFEDYNDLKRPAPHPNLADVAEQLAENPVYIKSLELFDSEDRVWHFAQNKNLQNNISKPSYFPESKDKLTDYLKNLDERKKRVLKDIAGIGADNNATLGDFDKLKKAYADWPDRYDVYYLGANGATCSFFVGECLYKSGLLTTQNKYFSALELRNSSLFAHINKQYVEKGDIVSMVFDCGIYHVEIITSVSADRKSFCSRGGGRGAGILDMLFGAQLDGVEKCDTNVPFDNVREFDNNHKLQFLRLKR